MKLTDHILIYILIVLLIISVLLGFILSNVSTIKQEIKTELQIKNLPLYDLKKHDFDNFVDTDSIKSADK